MESTWINHVKSPKLINLWQNDFNIICEMCLFILSWFSKVCDFEWGLFVFDYALFYTIKGSFYNTAVLWAVSLSGIKNTPAS